MKTKYRDNLASFLDEVIGQESSSRSTQERVVRVVEIITITEIRGDCGESGPRGA